MRVVTTLVMGRFGRCCRKAVKYGGVLLLGLAGLAYSVRSHPEVKVVNRVEQAVGKKFRVMTANIARGEGHDFIPESLCNPSSGTTDGIGVLEGIIREQGVDIACIQEIENAYTHGEDQPGRIAGNTPLVNYVFGQNYSFELPFSLGMLFEDGNSIHSKAALHNHGRKSFDMGNPSVLAKLVNFFGGIKGILHSQVFYRGLSGELLPVTIVCTHLSSNEFVSQEREFEMKALFEYAAKNTPAIVLGDLNTPPLGMRDEVYPHDFTRRYDGEMSWYIVKSVESMHGVTVHYDPRLRIFDESRKPEFPATYVGPAGRGKFGLPFGPDWNEPQKIVDYVLLVTHPGDRVKLKLGDTWVDYSGRCSDHAPVIADVEVVE